MEPKKSISHLVAGAILGIFMIVYSLGLYFTNMQQQGAAGWLAYCIMIAGLIIFIMMYGKANNNQVSFGNLFSYGFKATAFMTLIVVIYTVLSFIMIPEMKEKIFETARENLEKQGKLSESEIDKAIEMTRKFFNVFMIGGILLTYAIIGALGSLIGALVTKKRPYNPLEQLDKLDIK